MSFPKKAILLTFFCFPRRRKLNDATMIREQQEDDAILLPLSCSKLRAEPKG